jgi:lysophospholipase
VFSVTHPNSRFQKPDGFEFGTFKNDRGQDVRYGHVKTHLQKSKGTLVMGPGYAEPIEKYYELIKDLTNQGYDIWIMDWIGQGGSERHKQDDPQRTYDEKNFLEHHRDDLYKFVTKVVKAPKQHKLGYLGFSMGGHIGMRFLERYPYVFDTASMNSAMFDFKTGNYGRTIAEVITQTMVMAGKGEQYVPGGGEWSELKHEFNKNDKTHDPQRHRMQKELLKNNPGLRVGNPRFQWLMHAFPSVNTLKKKKILKKIRTPIVISVAGQDTVVSVDAQKRAARFLPNTKLHVYKRAKHELWIEEDAIRSDWLHNILDFVNPIMTEKRINPVRFDRKLIMRKSLNPPTR